MNFAALNLLEAKAPKSAGAGDEASISRGVRLGLNKGKPSGFFGKTSKEHSKVRMKLIAAKLEPKVERPELPQTEPPKELTDTIDAALAHVASAKRKNDPEELRIAQSRLIAVMKAEKDYWAQRAAQRGSRREDISMNFESALINFCEAVNLVEAYDPKREPTERDRQWEARKAEELKRYRGRTHKSGRSVKDMETHLAGKTVPRPKHERARWKATERPVGRGQPVLTAARAEIEAPEKTKPGPREGLSQGKRSGVTGKTFKEREKGKVKVQRPNKPKGSMSFFRSPAQSEVEARQADPEKAKAADEKLKAAAQRMKKLGRDAAEPDYTPDPRRQANQDKGRWTGLENYSKAHGGVGRRK